MRLRDPGLLLISFLKSVSSVFFSLDQARIDPMPVEGGKRIQHLYLSYEVVPTNSMVTKTVP